MRGIVALGLEPLPEGDNLDAKRLFIAFIVNDIVGHGGFFCVRDLVGEALAGIGFRSLAGGANWGETGDIAGNFDARRAR